MIKEKETGLPEKQTAIKELVQKGILSQPECDACIRALKSEASEKGVFFRDKSIVADYRGVENCEMLGGKGFKVFLILENRTPEYMSLRARIMLNGVIVEGNESLLADIPPRSKILVSHAFFYEGLKPLDIKALKHVKEVGYMFQYYDSKGKVVGNARKAATISL